MQLSLSFSPVLQPGLWHLSTLVVRERWLWKCSWSRISHSSWPGEPEYSCAPACLELFPLNSFRVSARENTDPRFLSQYVLHTMFEALLLKIALFYRFGPCYVTLLSVLKSMSPWPRKLSEMHSDMAWPWWEVRRWELRVASAACLFLWWRYLVLSCEFCLLIPTGSFLFAWP